MPFLNKPPIVRLLFLFVRYLLDFQLKNVYLYTNTSYSITLIMSL